MIFNIMTNRGINNIEFGMDSENVRRLMSAQWETGPWRNISPEFPTDWFRDMGVFAYYDAEGFLEAMEFHEPADVCLGGVNLLGLQYGEARSLLGGIDPHFSVDEEGADFRTLSIGLYVPDAGELADKARIESVLVGRSGYYDSL